MGEYISGAIAIFAVALTVLSGVALSAGLAARATLSAITAQASADMAVDGGYTAEVRSAVQSALAAHGLTSTATVNVMVNNGNSTNAAYYGETYTVAITYDLPVILPSGLLTIPVTTSAPGVSTYPCSAGQAGTGSCAAPATISGGGV